MFNFLMVCLIILLLLTIVEKAYKIKLMKEQLVSLEKKHTRRKLEE